MTALVAWLWQGVVLTAAVALLLRLVPRANAATRHAVWWAALAGLVGLLGIHLGGDAALVTRTPPWPGVAAPGAPDPIFVVPQSPAWLVACAAGCWVAFAAWGAVRIARGLRHAASLRADAARIDPGRVARLTMWARAGRQGRRAELRVTDWPIGACAVGFRRPVILVSRQLLDAVDDEVLDQVVMHEQAHLDRFDDWLRLVQALVTAVAGIHPAVHVVGRRIDLEREAACDDRVVSAGGAARCYASSLTEAALVTAPGVLHAVPGVTGGGSTAAGSLRRRIVRLLDPRSDHGRRLGWPAVSAALVLLAAVVATAPRLAPLIVAESPELALDNPLPARAGTVLPGGAEARPAAATEVRGPGAVQVKPRAVARESAGSAPRPRASARAALPSVEQPASLAAIDAAVPTLASSATHSFTIAPDPPPSTVRAPEAPAGQAGQPGGGGSGPSLLTDVSQLGRDTGAAAQKVSLAVAGRFTRIGRAIGHVF